MNTKLKKHFGSKPIVWVAAWGISKLRKRGGQFAGSINGAAVWYDDWYDRVMSKETAVKLAELGVNLIILPFSVGGSARMEQAERDDFERMTRTLHKCGIISLPYLQYQNILQEDFTFKDTVWGVRLDGSRKQFAYWRRTVCQSSPAFREYFKGLISDALRRGADGIWIDNTHRVPCRCDLCIRRFKQWLYANRRELLAELRLENFDRIEMPPFAGGADPITQALLDFNCRANLDILSEFKNHMLSIKPDALFASNPGIGRGSSNYDRGIDLRPLLELHDLMYLENKFFPSVADGQTTGNFHGFISCEAAGSMGIPGAWKRHDFDDTASKTATGMPETEPEIRRVIFEAAACGGAPGMLWAIRTRPEHMCDKPADLLTMYFEHPLIYSGMKKALDFVRSLPVFGDSRNIANIAVLHHRASLAFDPQNAWPAMHTAEEFLHNAGLPYNVLYSEDCAAQAGGYKAIILAGVSAMSQQDADALKGYVERGGRLLVLGDCGLYDERRHERTEFILRDVLGASRFRRVQEFIFNRYGAGICATLPMAGVSDKMLNNIMQAEPRNYLPAWHIRRSEVMHALDALLGGDRQIRMTDMANVAVTLRRTESGATAAHFVAYAPCPDAQALTIQIHCSLAHAKQAVWHTPGAGAQPAEHGAGAAGYNSYRLPGLIDYGVLII